MIQFSIISNSCEERCPLQEEGRHSFVNSFSLSPTFGGFVEDVDIVYVICAQIRWKAAELFSTFAKHIRRLFENYLEVTATTLALKSEDDLM